MKIFANFTETTQSAAYITIYVFALVFQTSMIAQPESAYMSPPQVQAMLQQQQQALTLNQGQSHYAMANQGQGHYASLQGHQPGKVNSQGQYAPLTPAKPNASAMGHLGHNGGHGGYNNTPQHGGQGGGYPPQQNMVAKFNISDSDEDDPNWPPPPPPEHMSISGVETGSSSTDPPRGAPVRRSGSVANSHASIIQTLNAKFASRQNSAPGEIGLPLDTSQPPRPPSAGSDDITPTAENQGNLSGDSGLLTQIQRGVKLRKTVSYDRSAPKFS